MTAIRAHWHNPEQARESLLTVIAPWAKAQMDAGESVDVYLSVHEDDRSLRQNKFYWGYVIKTIASQARIEGQRYTGDAWHELFKREHLGYEVKKVSVAGSRRKRVIRRLRSTTDLTVRQMSKFLESVIAFAVTDLNVVFVIQQWEQFDHKNPALVDQSTGEILMLEHA